MDIDNELLLSFLEKMILIRKFEFKLIELAERGIVRGSIHLCIGEEATAVGSCMAINNEDYILPTHRGHGQELAKGSDPNRLMAEILGKETGICKGRVGSMHIFDKDRNILGAQGVLGANISIAIGVGLAIKLKEIPERLVLCFFGDGTTNTGVFYEALNFAALWELPVIFIIINNQYAMGTSYDRACKVDIYKKGELFNIHSIYLDGNDVEKVYSEMEKTVKMVKKESKPALVELKTYRWMGHSAFDKRPYRPKEEIEKWKKMDPISRLEQKLLNNGINTVRIEQIKTKIDYIVNKAEELALESAYPVFDNSMEQ
jgi:acetoin:2,6-dichlorophenolindophenol oxidoreductase subunit alpha